MFVDKPVQISVVEVREAMVGFPCFWHGLIDLGDSGLKDLLNVGGLSPIFVKAGGSFSDVLNA